MYFFVEAKPTKNRWGASPGIGLLVVWSNREKEDFRFISSAVQTSEDFTGISRHCFFERVGWLVGWLILWKFGQIASKKTQLLGWNTWSNLTKRYNHEISNHIFNELLQTFLEMFKCALQMLNHLQHQWIWKTQVLLIYFIPLISSNV